MGDIAETSAVCTECHGVCYVVPRLAKVRRIRKAPVATENLEGALGASMILARGGVGRFGRAANARRPTEAT